MGRRAFARNTCGAREASPPRWDATAVPARRYGRTRRRGRKKTGEGEGWLTGRARLSVREGEWSGCGLLVGYGIVGWMERRKGFGLRGFGKGKGFPFGMSLGLEIFVSPF
ncbi:hypothetical protein SEVIR_3G253800v4 [Setaria viridis]